MSYVSLVDVREIWERTATLNVTLYEKIDHSQANMILQYGVQYLTQHYFFNFFSLQITKVWSFLYSLARFHANPSLLSDGNSAEKDGGSVSASYVNELTVLSINKNLQTAIRIHSDTRARLRSYSLGVMAEFHQPATCLALVCCLLDRADCGTLLELADVYIAQVRQSLRWLTTRSWHGAYKETLNVELRTNKTLRFSKNSILKHGLLVYNCFGITQLMNTFWAGFFDHWTQQKNLHWFIYKTRLARKFASGRFSHNGSQMDVFTKFDGPSAYHFWSTSLKAPFIYTCNTVVLYTRLN